VACGGGLPCCNNNMDFIKKSGISIYLKSSEDEILSRLSNSKERPLVQNKSAKDLRVFISEKIRERERFYLMANHTIDTSNLTDKDVLREINSLSLSI
jgi:shikimate kinase